MIDLNEAFEDMENHALVEVTVHDINDYMRTAEVEDFDLTKDDAYLLHVLAPEYVEDDGLDDHEDLESLDESVLSVQQRMKRANRMRRLSGRYAQLRDIKKKRMAPKERLTMRSRKAALDVLRRKVMGKSGKKYTEMSPQQKIQVDTMLARRYPGKKLSSAVQNLATRLMMNVRKKEMDRLSHARHAVNEAKKSKKSKSKCSNDDEDEDEDEDIEDDDEEGDGANSKGKPEHVDYKHLHTSAHDFRKKKLIKTLNLEARRSGHDSHTETDEGDSGIINQLRKAKIARGNHKIKWGDGSTSELPLDHINYALRKYAKVVNSHGPGAYGQDKQVFVRLLGKSEKHFYDSLQEAATEPKKKDKVEVFPASRVKVKNKEVGPGPLNPNPNMSPIVPTPMGGVPVSGLTEGYRSLASTIRSVVVPQELEEEFAPPAALRQDIQRRRHGPLWKSQQRSAGTTGVRYKHHPVPKLSQSAATTTKSDTTLGRYEGQQSRRKSSWEGGYRVRKDGLPYGSPRPVKAQYNKVKKRRKRIAESLKAKEGIKQFSDHLDKHTTKEKQVRKRDKSSAQKKDTCQVEIQPRLQ